MKYQRCKRCVMDNRSDMTIYFDKNGYCNYCNDAISRMKTAYLPNEEGINKLDNLLHKIKLEGKGKKYDCLMGISGGLDSSYLAYLGHKWGLRILAIHIDDGFDSDITKDNLKKLSESTSINLINIKIDQKQYNDLVRSFLLAGVPNIAMPQDNIYSAYLYKFARENKLKYFLSGGNFALESILQKGNTHNIYDSTNIKSIHKKHGIIKNTEKLIFISELEKDINRYIYRIKSLRPLNYIDYNRDKAFKELYDFCGYEYYGGKHLENMLTKFIQLYYLPNKFNVDKRTSHLSSLIVSKQITRKEAIEELKKPLYDEVDMKININYILQCLNLTKEEFDSIMKQSPKQHKDYKTSKYNNIKNVPRRAIGFLKYIKYKRGLFNE